VANRSLPFRLGFSSAILRRIFFSSWRGHLCFWLHRVVAATRRPNRNRNLAYVCGRRCFSTTANVVVGEPKHFTATVTHTSNTAVRWSVKEGAAGGTVDSTGNYVCSLRQASVHVIATSQADATKSATAAVTATVGAPPQFSSVAPTTAFEAEPYSLPTGRQRPSGGTVSFTLAAGAGQRFHLWQYLVVDPDTEQSRAANSFTITANTTEAAKHHPKLQHNSGRQHRRMVNTAFYDRSGTHHRSDLISAAAEALPPMFPTAAEDSARSPEPATAMGPFTIAGVPAGNYWLAGRRLLLQLDQPERSGVDRRPDRPSRHRQRPTDFEIQRHLNHPPQDGGGMALPGTSAMLRRTSCIRRTLGAHLSSRTTPSPVAAGCLERRPGIPQPPANHSGRQRLGGGDHRVVEQHLDHGSCRWDDQRHRFHDQCSDHATVRLNVKGSQFSALDAQLPLGTGSKGGIRF